MRVVLLNLAHPRGTNDRDTLLAAILVLVDWAEALRDAGATVEVVQGFDQDDRFTHRDVRYHLIAGPYQPFLHPLRVDRRSSDLIQELDPDVVHVNSLLYARQAYALRRRLATVGLVLQHHAEQPRQYALGRFFLRRWLRAVDAFVFTGTEAAAPWSAAGLLPAGAPIHAISEGSSQFRPAANRAQARCDAALKGSPLVLWLGNLDANKDPLTVLDGLEMVFARHPRARALCCFRQTRLLAQVKARIAASAVLRRSVLLRGHVPYAELEPLVQAADVLVQGSHHEGSGFAILDALACGVVPVVTDLPTLRFLTDDGAIGALWRSDDAADCARALETVLSRPLAPQQDAARAWFERALAYPVLAARMMAVYQQARQRASKHEPS